MDVTDVCIRDRSRLFVQVGHETTYASSRGHQKLLDGRLMREIETI